MPLLHSPIAYSVLHNGVCVRGNVARGVMMTHAEKELLKQKLGLGRQLRGLLQRHN